MSESILEFGEPIIHSYNFEVLSYDSQFFILNLGTVFVTFLCTFVAIIFSKIYIKIQRAFCARSRIFNKITDFLYSRILYGMIIRLFLESYIEIAISGFLQVKNISADGSGTLFSSIAAVCFLLACIVIPPALIVVYKLYKDMMPVKQFQVQYGSIYEDLRLKSDSAMLFVLLFMMRRLIISMSYVFLVDYPVFQWQICMISSVFQSLYVGLVLPYTSSVMNFVEIFNELVCLIICYFYVCMSEVGFDGKIRYDIGWTVILIVLISLLVNLLVITIFLFSQFK